LIAHFTLDGIPIHQQRPRVKMRGQFHKMYNPNANDLHNAKISLLSQISQIKSSFQKIEKDIPFSVRLIFYMQIPKTYSKKKRDDAIKGIIHHTACDIDNLIKFVLDACNEIIWHDDRSITEIHALKVFSDTPRTEIFVNV